MCRGRDWSSLDYEILDDSDGDDVQDLAFSDVGQEAPMDLAESIDEALAYGHGIDTLTISVEHPLNKACANSWLQQAAERVRGKISLWLDCTSADEDPVVLDMPCGGATTTAAMWIQSTFQSIVEERSMTVLRLPLAVQNASLTELEVRLVRLEGKSLSDFVSSSCCPNLRRLVLHLLWGLDGTDLRIANDALEELDIDFISGGIARLEVSSRNLRFLSIKRISFPRGSSKVATFNTPTLQELCCYGDASVQPHSRFEFLDGMDTVRRLNVGLLTHVETHESSHLGDWLLRRCTGVHRLDVSLRNDTKEDAANAINLMETLPKLNNVTQLTVTSNSPGVHTFGASTASLLSRCPQLQRLAVSVNNYPDSDHFCPAMCPCKSPTNWRDQNLSLDFLQQVEIYNRNSANWIDDLTHLLRRSNKAQVRKILRPEELSMCRENQRVIF